MYLRSPFNSRFENFVFKQFLKVWILIRIEKKCWIRIQLIRIRNTVQEYVGQKVKIQLMARPKEAAAAVSTHEEFVYGRVWAKSLGLWRRCLATRLLREGLATVAAYPAGGVLDPVAVSYMAQLQTAETTAKKGEKGVWQKKSKDDHGLWKRVKSWLFAKMRNN